MGIESCMFVRRFAVPVCWSTLATRTRWWLHTSQPAFLNRKPSEWIFFLCFGCQFMDYLASQPICLANIHFHPPGAQKACVGGQIAEKGYDLGIACDYPHMGNHSSSPQINLHTKTVCILWQFSTNWSMKWSVFSILSGCFGATFRANVNYLSKRGSGDRKHSTTLFRAYM